MMKLQHLGLILFSWLTLASCNKIEDEYQYKDELDVSWEQMAQQTTEQLIAQFWNQEGYFNYGSEGSDLGFQYWPNAHAMDVVIDGYLRTNDPKYSAYFDKWFEGVKKKNGNTYKNVFYDDMEWNALTMLRLFEITKEQKYMDAVLLLWNDILPAWNTEYAGGGLAWRKDMLHSKNACSNGPASILAARLYKLTKEEQYLEWAIRIYDWQKETLFDRATGAVYDNINGETDVVNKTALTYNQGTFLGTAVELFDITQDPLYMNDAQKIANYTITKCIDASNNVLRNEGDGDGALFKGIFVRYFVEFLLRDGVQEAFRSKFENFLRNNAKVAWTQGQDAGIVLFSPSWTQKPLGQTQLTSQSSAAMLFEGLVYFEKTHKNN
ncbi:glycoside hydrolase family 76 protein [Sphingobacterium faecium]|uniref:glycoside hydrolase family 76 protein n=1 Tax=Sphingobacterium faecium TaxID=34087 RepID=UPI002469AA89|nr:glycoside hydrolase family 76 protein [Sphingobacterium faecium]MDH5826346.1 glycoside hydrolase family 76 protein [Sphingobacterium faecium]